MAYKRIAVYFFILLIIGWLGGCKFNDDQSSKKQPIGDLAVSIKWENYDFERTHDQKLQFDCDTEGVANIEIIIYDKNYHEILHEDPWQCSAHEGKILGISHSPINIILLAKDNEGNVLYRGMEENVTISYDKINNIRIATSPFVPKLISPETKSCSTTPILKWHGVDGAKAYHVLVSDNKDMENATQHIVKETTYELLDVKNNTTIFWMVSSVDSQENMSRYSEVFHFFSNKSLLKEIYPGTESSNPNYLTAIGDKIFFSAERSEAGKKVSHEFWFTNGTTIGTKHFMDIEPGPYENQNNEFIDLNGDIIFSAEHSLYGDELWILRKDKAKPELLMDINPGSESSSFLFKLTKYKEHVYFSADNGVNGQELWRTDGTPEGTVLFKNIGPDGTNSGDPGMFTVAEVTSSEGNGEYLFFEANDGIHGNELWKTDGTISGTAMVKDISPDENGLFSILTSMDGFIFFQTKGASGNYELWKSNGTARDTFMVNC